MQNRCMKEMELEQRMRRERQVSSLQQLRFTSSGCYSRERRELQHCIRLNRVSVLLSEPVWRTRCDSADAAERKLAAEAAACLAGWLASVAICTMRTIQVSGQSSCSSCCRFGFVAASCSRCRFVVLVVSRELLLLVLKVRHALHHVMCRFALQLG